VKPVTERLTARCPRAAWYSSSTRCQGSGCIAGIIYRRPGLWMNCQRGVCQCGMNAVYSLSIEFQDLSLWTGSVGERFWGYRRLTETAE
jgi:hypothetical protein